MSWRSPPMVPRPIDPASVRLPDAPHARLALGASWRLRAFAHSLAHGLRRVPSPAHAHVARRIASCLDASDAFRRARALAADEEESERLVEARLVTEPLPQAASWAEVALADALFGGALEAAARDVEGSSDTDLAAAACIHRGEPFGESVLDELSRDEPNRACLQLLVERWMASCVHVFGRPGRPGDAEMVAARVKPRPAVDALASWLDVVERRMDAWGLRVPDAGFMGVDVPEGWAPRRRRAAHNRIEEKHGD